MLQSPGLGLGPMQRVTYPTNRGLAAAVAPALQGHDERRRGRVRAAKGWAARDRGRDPRPERCEGVAGAVAWRECTPGERRACRPGVRWWRRGIEAYGRGQPISAPTMAKAAVVSAWS